MRAKSFIFTILSCCSLPLFAINAVHHGYLVSPLYVTAMVLEYKAPEILSQRKIAVERYEQVLLLINAEYNANNVTLSAERDPSEQIIKDVHRAIQRVSSISLPDSGQDFLDLNCDDFVEEWEIFMQMTDIRLRKLQENMQKISAEIKNFKNVSKFNKQG